MVGFYNVPAFKNRFMKTGTLRRLSLLIWINEGGPYSVPVYKNRFMKAGTLRRPYLLIWINRSGLFNVSVSFFNMDL